MISRVRNSVDRRQGLPFDLDRGVYRTASIGLLAATALSAAWLSASGRWLDALPLWPLVLIGGAFVLIRKRLPAFFALLVVLAGLASAAGYIFDLWKTPVWFDEAIHAGTSFAIMAALGWILLQRTRVNASRRGGRLVLSLATLGLLLGIAWELFEWVIGIIGTPSDTLVDLAMDVVGAVAAGLFCAWLGLHHRASNAAGR